MYYRDEQYDAPRCLRMCQDCSLFDSCPGSNDVLIICKSCLISCNIGTCLPCWALCPAGINAA